MTNQAIEISYDKNIYAYNVMHSIHPDKDHAKDVNENFKTYKDAVKFAFAISSNVVFINKDGSEKKIQPDS